MLALGTFIHFRALLAVIDVTSETVTSISIAFLTGFTSMTDIVCTALFAICEAGETLVSIYSIRRGAVTSFVCSIDLETIYTLTSLCNVIEFEIRFALCTG